MLIEAAALTLAPAVRERTWQTELAWQHWLGVLVWLSFVLIAHREIRRRLPEADPFLFPLAALLSGWGLLIVFRLVSPLGLRQSISLAITAGLFLVGLRLQSLLQLLQRYKYIWLVSGLLLTALTLIFGTHPLGAGPRLWLGWGGVYIQPSEPLKLLLIIYLSAYLADLAAVGIIQGESEQKRTLAGLMPLLAPTLLLSGLSIGLLIVQRDLGTAALFFFLFGSLAYLATGRRQVLLVSLLMLVAGSLAGYLLFDLVQLRVEAWLNPWLDPSGRAYQIVQSLIAIANGGILGRGPGLGSPGLVPVAHSDFIFTALVEESGLLGGAALLLLLALLLVRCLRIALGAPDYFRRFLAFGIAVHLVSQSILIIGGNLRVLPLTGVTLPFVSYGGSSLLTSFIELLILLVISSDLAEYPRQLPASKQLIEIGSIHLAGLLVLMVALGWWTVYRSPALLARTDNPRRGIEDRYIQRGGIVDRNYRLINTSTGSPGSYAREYRYPALAPVVGYIDPVFGQSGIEASLDSYLRGVEGNPGMEIWQQHLLYGQPPPGLDVRLTLDLLLQERADSLLAGKQGAVLLMNAQSGEILVMASQPGFDPTSLNENWSELLANPGSPLVNRLLQASYAPGTSLGAFYLVLALAQNPNLPALPASAAVEINGSTLECLSDIPPADWGAATANGCPTAHLRLADRISQQETLALEEALQTYRFYSAPLLRLPVSVPSPRSTSLDWTALALGVSGIRLNPLQLGLAVSALSNRGVLPAPRLVSAVNTPASGWVVLGKLDQDRQLLDAGAVEKAVEMLAVPGKFYWQALGASGSSSSPEIAWYLAGATSSWQGSPLALVVALERDTVENAQTIGQALLETALVAP